MKSLSLLAGWTVACVLDVCLYPWVIMSLSTIDQKRGKNKFIKRDVRQQRLRSA